jgi:hypothetical protein
MIITKKCFNCGTTLVMEYLTYRVTLFQIEGLDMTGNKINVCERCMPKINILEGIIIKK